MNISKCIAWLIPVCIVSLSFAQVLFKQVSLNYNKTGALLSVGVLGIFLVAAFLYAVSTGLWLWILRFVELTKAYPYFALSFAIVPLLGAWIFNETLSLRYGLGVLMIVAGVVMTSSA